MMAMNKIKRILASLVLGVFVWWLFTSFYDDIQERAPSLARWAGVLFRIGTFCVVASLVGLLASQHSARFRCFMVVGILAAAWILGIFWVFCMPGLWETPFLAGIAWVAGGVGKRFGKTAKVLVVDDEHSIRVLLKRMLAKKGYCVKTASDGREALEVLREHDDIDVVISDILMPKMNGFALLKVIVEKFPKIPVIMITGHSTTYTMDEALKAGAYAYIHKPFEAEEVYNTVEEATAWLEEKRAFFDRHSYAQKFIPNKRKYESVFFHSTKYGLQPKK